MPTTHHRGCHLCEAMCGVSIDVEGDRVVAIRGDELDPFSRGHVCPKAIALGEIHHDPDRLRRPLRKKGRDFEEVSWDDALDEVATRLSEVREAHGRFAVGVYQGNPTIHNYGQALFSQLVAKALRSRSMYSATSVDQLPKMLASHAMFGHQLLMSVPDVDRTMLFVVFGANPVVSNGSLMSAPGMRRRIAEIRARGGKVVVFDPRRTETAELADEHHFVRPGTDAYVLLSMVQVLFAEGLVDLGRFSALVDGLDALEAAARAYPPEATAPVTGVSAEVVRGLARALAETERAVVYGRVGVSMQRFGGLSCWLVEALNLVTRHFDEPGGMMFTTPAVDLVDLFARTGQKGHFGVWKTPVRGLPEFGGELPAACLAEEIESDGDDRIRALLTMAGNPVLSTPNGRRLEAALPKLEFMAAVDIYVNETTRHAHVILPPTFALEHDHYDVALAQYAVRNVAKYSPAVFERGEDQRHDHEILVGLASRLLARRKGVPGVDRALSFLGRAATPRRVTDLLLRVGPHGALRGGRGLSITEVERSVHGIDLGPLERTMPGRLSTEGGRIALAPAVFLADLPRLAEAFEGARAAAAGFVLIGRRQLRTNNSWGHNAPHMVKGRDRCTAILHPEDAASLGVGPRDQLRITSRVGAIEVPVELDAGILRGVVSVPHGFGHDRPGTRLRVAAGKPGRSINDVTDELAVDALTGVADFSGVPVTLARVEPPAGA